MSYEVLARRLRPVRFCDLAGQEPIWKTLINAIKSDRVAHAFLFTGPRGTGKTSCARILTKALNCSSPVESEPCNQCENCDEINRGVAVDVVEIDAASNRGIEHIRGLRDGIKFSPAKCRFRSYIIDEVHMLTTESFNALLKTLEEPPNHIKFILATTDQHKVPSTIVSRCQRYDFVNIPVPIMTEYLENICVQEKIEISESALQVVAIGSGGGMRDALTTIDMLVSFCGNKIDDKAVSEILGLNDEREVDLMFQYIVEKKFDDLLNIFHGLVNRGRSLSQIVTDLLRVVTNISLLQTLQAKETTWLEILPSRKELYLGLAGKTTTGRLQQYFQILIELETQLKRSSQAQICVEMSLIKMYHVESLVGVGEVISLLREASGEKKKPSLKLLKK